MEASKGGVILAQAEVITSLSKLNARQGREIRELTKRVDELVNSLNWYESETRQHETFELLRIEKEQAQATVKMLYEGVPCRCESYTFQCIDCRTKLEFDPLTVDYAKLHIALSKGKGESSVSERGSS